MGQAWFTISRWSLRSISRIKHGSQYDAGATIRNEGLSSYREPALNHHRACGASVSNACSLVQTCIQTLTLKKNPALQGKMYA